jgi:hypothetical protein
VTKTIRDNCRIYSLIIILYARIVASVRCGFFKMSNVNHLTMLLPKRELNEKKSKIHNLKIKCEKERIKNTSIDGLHVSIELCKIKK